MHTVCSKECLYRMDVSYHEEPTVNSGYEKDNSSFY